MIRPDSQVIGHRRVRVGEPRPVQPGPTSDPWSIDGAIQQLLEWQRRVRGAKMWSAVVEFSSGRGMPVNDSAVARGEVCETGGTCERADEQPTSDALIEPEGTLQDERPPIEPDNNLVSVVRDYLYQDKLYRFNGNDVHVYDTFPVPPMPRVYSHAPDCDYHTDQYPWECTCGATEKAT